MISREMYPAIFNIGYATINEILGEDTCLLIEDLSDALDPLDSYKDI